MTHLTLLKLLMLFQNILKINSSCLWELYLANRKLAKRQASYLVRGVVECSVYFIFQLITETVKSILIKFREY